MTRLRLLLDTHVMLAILDERQFSLPPPLRERVLDSENDIYASVVSIWEIAIKHRLQKLRLGVPLMSLPSISEEMGHVILPIDQHHVLANLDPEPPTRDPFDRLLLAQCQVEGLRLVTLDRALAHHPLALQ